MSDPIRVSVIIPTRDRREAVLVALHSVQAQTRAVDEIIVVDDGSSDATAQVVRDAFPAVTVMVQDHRGVSAARNRGIAAARGNWIAFLDSDDEWLPRKLERQLDTLADAPHVRLCHTDEIWVRNGRRVNPRHKHAKAGGWIFRRCLPLCCSSPSAALVRRDVFDTVGVFDEALPVCEDYDLWLRICSREPVAYVDEALIVKRGGHADQLSRRFWGMDRFRIHALERILGSQHLSPADRVAALEMLCQKLEIYLTGARKRRKQDEILASGEKLEWAVRQLHSLRATAIAPGTNSVQPGAPPAPPQPVRRKDEVIRVESP
jgi:glycosyltransferase involved in cell wall biosynthesis